MDDNESTENLYSPRVSPSKDQNNWLTVGELIRIIKEPVAFYTSKIIEEWHAKLSCLSLPPCTNPAVCLTRKDPRDLCHSCKTWYDELAKSHRNKDKRQIKWRENCDTSKWQNDPWEVAKFFMPALGDNKMIVNDADSTDLSSLLNVLAWLKDAAFAPDRRVDDNLVTDFRSKVRNPWAHAPNQKLTKAFLIKAFDIANKFVGDLDVVFSCDEVKKCAEDVNDLKINGLCFVRETELKILNLQLVELSADISQMKDDQSSDRLTIKNQEEKLKKLEANLKSLQDIVNNQGTCVGKTRLKSCIPDQNPNFTGRCFIVNQIISSIVENQCGIVCIVGGPGFGKSTVAVKVSHDLYNSYDIAVIFSFLQNALTVREVIRRLCHDVGVNPGENPESSLMLWSKSIERKIVLVMDNIEQLLEDSDMKSELTGLILNLRKNSQRYLQILTTTRVKFTIHEESTIQYHEIVEFDEESSVELLKKCCSAEDMTDTCLSDLANLCGYVPLALCIAGTLMPDLNHPSKLIQWLREKPLEALENSDQCVRQAIEFSFHKLSDEDQKALVCLSVFDGDFQSNSAEEIIVRNDIETIRFLNNLVSRSLLQRTMDKRFVIHSLIRRFLADHGEFKDVRATAQRLMVRHFLQMCHSLTIKCYSHNKFESARELLKKDIHNIEETLKICTQVQDHTTISKANISELIASSDVYKSSYLFFHNFSWDLLPEKILKSFFECCINLAGRRNEPAIQILFQCLAAAQEGRDSAWKSTEYTNRIKTIMTEFRKVKTALKEDRLAFMFCCHLLGKYYLNKEPKCLPPDLAKYDYLPFSPESEVKRSPIEKAANAYILMMHGLLCKMRAKKEFRGNEQKSKEFMDQAELSYNQALSLARNYLGDHELTCTLYRHFGDLFFDRRNDKALTYYTDAINLHKKLKLDCNEKFVMLLKNSAGCLSFSGHLDESVERLQEARDIANKITEEKTRFKAQVCCDLAINCSFLKPYRQKAAEYAKEAMEMKAFLDSRKEERLRTIIVWP